MNPVSQTGRSTDNDSRQRLTHAEIKSFHPGITEMNPSPNPVICMFLGPSVETICMRNGRTRRGREVAGDLDIVPADTKCSWETKQAGSLLLTILIALVVVWAGFKLLGLAFKLVGILIVVGAAAALYLGAQKLIGKS